MEEQGTMDDFTEMMKIIRKQNEGREFVLVTGYGGHMTIILKTAFRKYGNNKLPRKLKKKVFLTGKLRKEFLPEYYSK